MTMKKSKAKSVKNVAVGKKATGSLGSAPKAASGQGGFRNKAMEHKR